MSDDVYGSTVAGGLKLKGLKNAGIKKKKKKKKSKAEEIESMASSSSAGNEKNEIKNDEQKDEEEIDNRTPAEIAFEKTQEKRAAERILKKASKTHKQRVEELNQYLDGLSEHYDIQKVSWTK